MPNDQNGVFRVGVTRDVRWPNGTFRFAPFDLAPLDRAGISWQFLENDALTPDSLADVDGLYHYAVPLTNETLSRVERLAVIARHGVGLDFLDLRACTARAVAVTITSGGVTRPMASAAALLVLALAHRLRERDRALHEGDWGAGRFRPVGTGLSGRTLGVIGYGRIGRDVVRLLEPWGMRVLVT
jgi:phosphoglycerate dehydrogenase-like enzyme